VVAELLVAKVLLGAPVAAEGLLAADQRQARGGGPADGGAAEEAVAAPRREVAAFVRDHAAERGADALPGLVLFTEHWLAEVPAHVSLCPLILRRSSRGNDAPCAAHNETLAISEIEQHHPSSIIMPHTPTCNRADTVEPVQQLIFPCSTFATSASYPAARRLSSDMSA